MLGLQDPAFFLYLVCMKRTEKDKMEKKRLAYLREWRQEIINSPTGVEFNDELKKKYGFTQVDWHKAVRLTQHMGTRDLYASGIGYKKAIQMDKERDLLRSEMNDEIAAMREDNET